MGEPLPCKIVIAFDIGTTYSGISYCFVQSGSASSSIHGVTRFPNHESGGGNSKIPTVIIYDGDGKPLKIGAEAERWEAMNKGSRKVWNKAEWFKLCMQPNIVLDIPALPIGKNIIDVFADYLRYLHQCVLRFITETHLSGSDIVKLFQNDFEYIISHPNSWEGPQQSNLRKAAELAGLIPCFMDHRLHFVTEGEAALHYCLHNSSTSNVFKKTEGVMVVDAGGGTVDMSMYRQYSSGDGARKFQEIAIPKCVCQGSVFVTRMARRFLKDKLQDTYWQDDLDDITSQFDKTTKKQFLDRQDSHAIKVGRSGESDERLHIQNGYLQLSGDEVAFFFQPSVEAIVQAIQEQIESAQAHIHSILLVGGYAASDWLYHQIRMTFGQDGIEVCRPDRHVNKVVADGAISYYLDHYVTVRIARNTYGVPCYSPFDLKNYEHWRRSQLIFEDADGKAYVPNTFSSIILNGTQVQETMEFRQSFFRMERSLHDLENPMMDRIMCYRGKHPNPEWTDLEPDMFEVLCTIYSDISDILRTLRPKRGKNGKCYFHLEYEVILMFGLTELKAQTSWRSKGREHRSPAMIVYETDRYKEVNIVRRTDNAKILI